MRSPLNTGDFADTAPASAYHQLLDQGVCMAGVSTMYRILREHDEVRERHRPAVHPAHTQPELPPTRPNEIRSRDVSCADQANGSSTTCHLYSIIDIQSRYTVVWMVAVRADVLTAVYERNPERFVNKPPTPLIIPTNVWINQPDDHAAAQ
ncbi:hypothetical protein [Streptomyces europaeiscabiei]|uniref:hypothetical protein n=1 Tax=Streptomyces europaeiscabiei TaxID=146819 RepID=UPI002E2B0406|nr:hypothetical protein [Streptomyces europaeiscabiei]